MPTQNVIEISRSGLTYSWEKSISWDVFNAGSLARIADALETMSKPYTELLNRVRYQGEDIDSLRKRNAKMENRVRGLRGALTRKKRAA